MHAGDAMHAPRLSASHAGAPATGVGGPSIGPGPVQAAIDHARARIPGDDVERGIRPTIPRSGRAPKPRALRPDRPAAGLRVILARVYAGFLDLHQPLFWTVDDALPADLCAEYIDRFRRRPAELAPIVGEGGRPVIELATRNNTRIMWDDPDEAARLLERVRTRVPARLSGLALAGCNPRLRIYRYGVGEKHGAHWDTVVELADGVRSLLTLVFYLNDGFDGGETDFVELGARVAPRTGRALLFQHRVLHQASGVRAGEKFVLRTDVLYGPARDA